MSINIDIYKRLGSFSLSVKFFSENGVAALLGASGCGKTLTLRCIAGIITPDRGEIILNGRILFSSEKRINLPAQARCVGYLFQNYALFPNMNVEQNIGCGLSHEKDRRTRSLAIAEIIRRMRLIGLEKHRPHQLSGGQQQRTALARILVGKPEILLLDEPFNALDTFLKDQLIAELMSTLKTFDKNALLVTHNRDEAYMISSKLAIMDSGRIVCSGETKRMFAEPVTRTGAVLTGCKNVVDAKKAGDTLVAVPAWGAVFDAGRPVKDGLCAIGIRAHYFSADIVNNSFPIQIVETIEEPFEWTIKFKYSSQVEGSNLIWWRISKGQGLPKITRVLGVLPKDIMLLF